MKPKMYENSPESAERILFVPPAVESFANPELATSVWPEQLTNNKEFLKQLKARRELNERLDIILSRLPRPDLSLQEAISQGNIAEKQVADLYTSLSDLIESGHDYERIILYIPFEFLPNPSWKPSSEELRQTAERFRAAYMMAWNNLLKVHDVRANFVDGDVLEVESRVEDLPRVVKAAHLIPKLVSNGLMKIEEVLKLMETSKNETLKHSIADTLPVLADLGLIGEEEMSRLKASDDSLMKEAAFIITSSEVGSDQKKAVGAEPNEISLLSLQGKLHDEFERIDAEKFGNVTKKRAAWLRQEKKQKAIESAGEDIGAAIANKAITDDQVAEFAAPEADAPSQQALVEGIRKAIESVARINTQEAQSLYTKYQGLLLSLWEIKKPEVCEALSRTFCRLHGLDLVDDKQLDKLNIVIPTLAGPFSENLKSMKEEMRDIQDIVALIEADPELSQYIYPVVLVFGSRLKGYGAKNADIDIGVFVRPDVSFGDRGKLQASLKNMFTHEKIQGEIVEFWLEKNDDGLAVRDFGEYNASIGDSSWTHVLFGAAWEGDRGAISELREKLLVPYMFDVKKTVHGREARGLYLEELERDTLQYRLMHKGYGNFFPSVGGINTPHSDRIDGHSVFWDSGYRQLATKLFASRVFLPKISKS